MLQRHYQKAAAFVLRSVAKHTAELAQCVAEAGALECLVECLEVFDPGVKEAAAWALGYVASHTPELAQQVVDSGAVPLLVICLQEPEIGLKRICASALSDVSRHSQELAQVVASAGAVPHLAGLIGHKDAKLKRQVCACLSHIAKHNVDLAEIVVEAEIFPAILPCLKDEDLFVRKNAAVAIREVAKHSEELANLVVAAEGGGALVEYVYDSRGNARLPGIMALGYIGAFSESLSMSLIKGSCVPALKQSLLEEPEDHLKSASAWALGQIGRHTAEHARAIAENDVLRHLLATMTADDSSDDLVKKSKRSLKAIIGQCTYLTAMEPLLKSAPAPILKCILSQFQKVLPMDKDKRRALVQSGGLRSVQELDRDDPEILDYVEAINSNYPEEVVTYCSPQFQETLASRVMDDTR